MSGVKSVGKVMQTVESSLEGEPSKRNVINQGGVLHECADKVIGHQVHEQLFADHGRRQTAQHVPTQQDLNLAKMQFYYPALEISSASLAALKRWASSKVVAKMTSWDRQPGISIR